MTNCTDAPFYRPSDDSAEIKYMQARRKQLGGYMPERKVRAAPLNPVPESHFEEFYKGTDGREASTTMVFVRLLAKIVARSRTRQAHRSHHSR